MRSIKLTFVGGVVSAVLAFALNVVAARFLDNDDFVIYGVIFNTSIIIASVFEFGLPSSILVINNKKGKIDAYQVLSFVLSWLLIALILSVPFFYISDNVYLLGLCLGIALAIYKILNTTNQLEELWGTYSLNNIFMNVIRLAVLFFVLVILELNSVEYIYTIQVIAVATYSLFMLNDRISVLNYKALSKLIENKSHILRIFIVSIFVALLMRVDVLVLYFKNVDIKHYFLATSLCMLIPLLASSISVVFIRSNNSLKVDIKKQCFGSIIVFLAYFIFTPYVSRLLFGVDSELLYECTIVISLTYCIALLFVERESYLYNHDSKSLVVLKLIQLFSMLIFAYYLIDLFGAMGMAWAVFISRLFGWAYMIFATSNSNSAISP